MNILFLSLIDIDSFNCQNIYMDLLNEFIKKKYNVFIVSPIERRYKKKTHIIENGNSKILRVKIGNIQKTNIIEKGISTILIESQFKKAIKKYFKGIKFDLILYATPPITFCNTIKYFKKRDNAKTYLMLKDIFPQNAVDLKMFSKKSVFYKFFRKKEINLYKLSDTIGCMSPKNKEYLLKHNDFLDESKVEVFPNCINPKNSNKRNMKLNEKYRKKYNIPLHSKVFMYGGNLGKPQGIPFIIECLKKVSNIKNTFFVICGDGTEYKKIESYQNKFKMKNLLLIKGLPKNEYTELLNVADVGLIFLDYNFTIPNFPSRLLSYMEKGIPVLSCTDPNTDIGDIIEGNNFGWKCYSNNAKNVKKCIEMILNLDSNDLETIGKNGLTYLNENYRCDKNVTKIENKIKIIKVLILTTVMAPYRVELFNEISKNKNIELEVYFEQKSDNVRDSSWYNYNNNFNAHFLRGSDKSLKSFKYDFIKKLRERNKYDLVIFYEPSTITSVLAIRYCIIHKIRYMLNCDGAILDEKENIIKKIIKTRSIKNANGLIANGNSSKEYYLHYNASENVIYNHHFSNLYSSEILKKSLLDSSKREIKKQLGLNYKYIFISVGNFIYRKGFDLLLESVQQFNKENINFKDYGFVIIGAGKEKDKYINYINEYELCNVTILDFMSKDNLLKYYKAADAFILLTRYEIWGLVIHEAMANGLPIISTNMCNAAIELIEDEKYGFIIDIKAKREDIISEVCEKMNILCNKYDTKNIKAVLEKAGEYTIEISAKEHLDAIKRVVD